MLRIFLKLLDINNRSYMLMNSQKRSKKELKEYTYLRQSLEVLTLKVEGHKHRICFNKRKLWKQKTWRVYKILEHSNLKAKNLLRLKLKERIIKIYRLLLNLLMKLNYLILSLIESKSKKMTFNYKSVTLIGQTLIMMCCLQVSILIGFW